MSLTAKRAIAAPFQPKNTTTENLKRPVVQPLPIQLVTNNSLPPPTSPRSTPRGAGQLVDFRTHAFQKLQPFNELTLQQYCGPTAESNWVIPGVLLVGAYPATQDDNETFDLITSILKLGVKKFVCLQHEYRDGVPQELWRAGLALRPYFEDVEQIVTNKHRIPELSGHPVADKSSLTFVHCPIVDCDITDDSTVLKLSRKLVEDISRGEVIYLHCWGGHGRTGTIVSIMLHLMYGISAMEAMRRCQAVHDLRRCPVEVGSPQTQTQREQVVRVVSQLISSYSTDGVGCGINLNLNLSLNLVNTEPHGSGKATMTPRRRSESVHASSASLVETVEVSAPPSGSKLPRFQEQKVSVAVSAETVSRSRSQAHGRVAKQGPLRSSFQRSAEAKNSLLSLTVQERTAPAVDPVLAVKPLAMKTTVRATVTTTTTTTTTTSSSTVGSSSTMSDEELFAGDVSTETDQDLMRLSSEDGADRGPAIQIHPLLINNELALGGDKEDEVQSASAALPLTPRRTLAYSENSVRSALSAARQVLLSDSVSAAPFMANEGDIDTPRKKMVPTPPAQGLQAGKSPGMSNRRLEGKFHSVV